MLNRKPLYPTSLTPEEIIGDPGDVGLLESHYVLAMKESDPERYEKAMQKKFSEHERVHIATLYEKLRDFGVWPDGIDKFGNLVWAYAVMGDLQRYVESLPMPAAR